MPPAFCAVLIRCIYISLQYMADNVERFEQQDALLGLGMVIGPDRAAFALCPKAILIGRCSLQPRHQPP